MTNREGSGRAGRVYRAVALHALNTLLALVVVNVILAVAFGIADRTRRPRVGALRHSRAALDRAYPQMSASARDSMLGEIWGRGLAFEPFTMFREPATHGRFVNVSDAGFRLVPDQAPWPPERDRTNVFVFGGSTTFGYGLPDDQTIPAHLQRALATVAAPDRPVAVYNFGRAYYYSTQERVLFERLLLAGRVPDVAVFIDGLNDFYYADRETERSEAFERALDPRPPRMRTGAMLLALARRAPLGRLAAMLAGGRGARSAPPDTTAGGEAKPTPERIGGVIERYRRNQQLIAATAASFGVRALFVWQPVPTYKYDLSRHAFAEAGFERHALSGPGYAWFDAALASGVIRPAAGFLWCADIAEQDTVPCYVDRVHYSGHLCRRIAERIAGAIASQRMIASR